MREDHRAHIAAVSDQPWCLAETQLQAEQSMPDHWQNSNFRCSVADFLGPDRAGNIFICQKNMTAVEMAIQMLGSLGQPMLIIERDAAAQRRQRGQTIQRT